MNKLIKLIAINKLKSHEQIDYRHFLEVKEKIKKDGFINNPVIVDKNNYVIIDGHHRVMALKSLKAKKIPSFLVDYFDKKIKVYLRRKELKITNLKKAVIKASLSNNLFPSKTTGHLIKNQRPRNIKISLNSLL